MTDILGLIEIVALGEIHKRMAPRSKMNPSKRKKKIPRILCPDRGSIFWVENCGGGVAFFVGFGGVSLATTLFVSGSGVGGVSVKVVLFFLAGVDSFLTRSSMLTVSVSRYCLGHLASTGIFWPKSMSRIHFCMAIKRISFSAFWAVAFIFFKTAISARIGKLRGQIKINFP